jgi:hypothetical protein
MESPPQTGRHRTESGSTLIVAICTILIISLIGANVLLNCTTRYNVTARQVKAWKEALYAAEGGGDIAFAEVRKTVINPSAAFPSSNWQSPAASPVPTPGPSYVAGPSYSTKTPTPYTFGQGNPPSLSTSVTVDSFSDPSKSITYYRIRATGTAKLLGLARVGMDDRIAPTTRGDSLLRKIDFKYDHFRSTYGDGDLNNKTIQTVPNPQVTRRIELIAVPQMVSFTGSLKVGNSFNGPGSAGQVDSYDSKNGAYPGKSIAANPVPPTDPNYIYYINSRNGDVSVATASFSEGGPIYGNVTTNGGNVTSPPYNISGTIDNNVPFTIPPLVSPNTTTFTSGSGSTLNLPSGTSPAAPAQYVYSSLSGGLTINGQTGTNPLLPSYGKPIETYVTIVVGSAGSTTGNVGNITIGAGVNAKIYFTGSMNVKAQDLVNNNVDGAVGVFNPDGITPSTDYSRAGHMQFYGISPTDGSTQSIAIAPPGDVYASIYAPSGDITLTGNPGWYGAIAARSFSGNGVTGFHYDKEIVGDGTATDYQIASYVEDVR